MRYSPCYQMFRRKLANLLEEDRISIFKEVIDEKPFTRKDYLQYFKTISPATASRDLKSATEKGILNKFGDKRLSNYTYVQ